MSPIKVRLLVRLGAPGTGTYQYGFRDVEMAEKPQMDILLVGVVPAVLTHVPRVKDIALDVPADRFSLLVADRHVMPSDLPDECRKYGDEWAWSDQPPAGWHFWDDDETGLDL